MNPTNNFSRTTQAAATFRAGAWLMLGLYLFILPAAFSQSVRWIFSTESAPWVETNPPALSGIRDDAPYDLVVQPDQPRQTIDGWGGCFNELGWEALRVLEPAERAAVLKAIFDFQTGLDFTLCRMPIGASDYATNWYSLDETPDDFELKHFSLDRDRTILIPYLKAAMRFQPGLKIWGSPWSPPAWMKMNHHYGAGGTNQFIRQEKYLAAYARYFSQYVKAYRAEGIPVVAVAVQNEPFFGPGYPSCQWTPEAIRDFIRDDLGPTFQRERTDAEIWLGTFNNNNVRNYDVILSDPRASAYVSAVGVQWAGKNALPEINARYPRLKKIQTESECGSGSFDWSAAEYTFSLMRFYLKCGVNVYTYWNMILDETGKSTWGWKQNALVTVNQTSGKVTYTPEFYLFKHFTKFVPKGSVMLASFGNFEEAVAFRDPAGQVVLVMINNQRGPRNLAIKVGEHGLEVQLPPKSFNSFVL
jgi:glucosylceramidase